MNQLALPWNADSSQLRWMDWLAAFLLLGYLCMTRSFAHLGVSPIYIGEIALAVFLFAHPQPAIREWIGSQCRPSAISGISWCFYLFVAYGVIALIRGIGAGYDVMTSLLCAVIHVYPLYFFAGWWIGGRHANFLPKTIFWMAWLNGIYGLVFIPFILHTQNDMMTGSEVGWFGDPRGASVAIIGLLCFGRHLKRAWLPLLLNIVVLVGMHNRSAWVAMLVCVPLWGLLAGRVSTVLKATTAAVAVLLLFLIVDAPLPMRNDEGERMTTRNVVGFAVAAIDRDTAVGLTQYADSGNSTVTWRTRWWDNLWRVTHQTPTQALFGPGYGFPIWEYHEENLDDFKLRTPHNSFFYVLVYTGWIGVILFFGLQFVLATVLWRVYCTTGQPFGICFWALSMIRACFTPFYETPYCAIPFFLICGLAAAPLLRVLPGKEIQQASK